MRLRVSVVLSLFALVPCVAPAQIQPLGARFGVNTYTNETQYDSAVAATLDGDFMVVWSSYQDGGGRGYSAGDSPPTEAR